MVHNSPRVSDIFQAHLKRLFLGRGETLNEVFYQNAVKVFAFCRMGLHGQRFKTSFRDLKFNQNKFFGEFVGGDWSDVRFLNCSFTDLSISDQKVSNVIINKSVVANCALDLSDRGGTTGLAIDTSSVRNLRISGAAHVRLRENQMSELTIQGPQGGFEIEKCTVDSGVVEQRAKQLLKFHDLHGVPQ
jgi:hypothetical protein